MAVRGTSATFIGRTDELATLDRLLGAGGDRLKLVLIGGEAGIGKSRLIAEWAGSARERGALVLVGGAVDVGETAALPYVAIVEALRPFTVEPGRSRLASAGSIGADLARLLPRLGPSPTSPARVTGLPEEFAQVRLFEQLLALLTRLAVDAPTVLALEDLQWADQSTRDLLVYLAHNVRDAPIGLIGSFRTDELPPLHPMRAVLGQLIRGTGTARLDLRPFGPEEHAAHVAELLGSTPAPALLRATYARSEGNPFYTEELLASGDPDTARLPESLRDALLVRLRELSPAAREVARVIGVGWSVPHPLLSRVAALDETALLAALRETVDRGVVVPDPETGRYGFRHPLIVEAVYADLMPAERSRLHRAFAEALAADPGLGDASPARAAAELANHWYAAGVAREALPALIVAADEARGVHAQGEALTHLVRATELVDRMQDADGVLSIERWELDDRTALAAEAVGDFERAVDSWQHALEHAADADPAVRADLLVRLGETEFLAGRLDRFVAARRAAVELVPPEPPTALRAFVLAKLAIALSLASQLADARPMAEKALAVARRIGSRPEEGKALSTLGTVLYLSGASEIAVRYLRQGLVISEELGRFGDEAIDRSNLSEALHQAGELREAVAVVLEGLDRARANGLERTYGETMSAIAVNWLFLLGRWDEAERMAGEVLEHAPRGLSADWTAMALAELEIVQGRFDEAAAHLDRVLGGDRSARSPGWYGPHEQRAHLLMELGRPAEAVREVRDALDALDRIRIAPEAGEIRWLAIRGIQAATEMAEDAQARGERPHPTPCRSSTTWWRAWTRTSPPSRPSQATSTGTRPATCFSSMRSSHACTESRTRVSGAGWPTSSPPWITRGTRSALAGARRRRSCSAVGRAPRRLVRCVPPIEPPRPCMPLPRSRRSKPSRDAPEFGSSRRMCWFAVEPPPVTRGPGSLRATGAPRIGSAASRLGSARCWPSSPAGGRTARSHRRCSSVPRPPASTSRTSRRSSPCAPGSRPRRWPFGSGSWTLGPESEGSI